MKTFRSFGGVTVAGAVALTMLAAKSASAAPPPPATPPSHATTPGGTSPGQAPPGMAPSTAPQPATPPATTPAGGTTPMTPGPNAAVDLRGEGMNPSGTSASGTSRATASASTSAEGADNPDPLTHFDDSPVAEQGKHHAVALEISPLSAFIGQWGATLEILPAHHHALVLSAYYYATRTGSSPQGPGGSPDTLFRGVGGEIGYRYYTGAAGPRGIFLGPSLLLGYYYASPSIRDQNGTPADIYFGNLGFAFDFGYQAVIAERAVVGFGVGAQYTHVTKSFPDQEWPSSVHANTLVYPRVLFSLGWALD